MTNPPPIPWTIWVPAVLALIALITLILNGLWYLLWLPIWAVPLAVVVAAGAYMLMVFDERKWP